LSSITATLDESQVRRGQRNVLMDGLTSQVMTTLTSSVFLVAFALTMGASDIVIGLLAAIPSLSNVIQVPTVYLVERMRVRRGITLAASALSRAMLLLIASVPFLAPGELAIPLMLIGLVAHATLASVGGCSWNSWMHDLLPQSTLGSFFSRRLLLATLAAMPLAIAAGEFVSWWAASFPGMPWGGYSVLFVCGFLSGIAGVALIAGIPEPRMSPLASPPSFKDLVQKPFQDRNFKSLIAFLGSWNFAINLALPFFTVYMLTSLGLSTSDVVMLTVLGQMSSLGFYRIWGRLSDRYSNKSVLRVSGPIMVGTILIWAGMFLVEGTSLVVPLVLVAHLTMGMAQAGVNLVSGNIGLKLAPKGEGTSYLASSTLFSSLAAGVAPLVGGALASHAPSWHVFFLAAFLLGLYSLHRLRRVSEEGDVDDRTMAKELVREMRSGVSPSRLRSFASSMVALHALAVTARRAGGHGWRR